MAVKNPSINPNVPYDRKDSTTLTTMQEQATLMLIKYIMEEAHRELDLKDFGILNKAGTEVEDITWNRYNAVQKIIFTR